MFDWLVYIGRFQPFHNGHYEILKQAFSLSRNVVVGIGSSFIASDVHNPFSFFERKVMITNCFPEDEQYRLFIKALIDFPDNDAKWADQIIGFIRDKTMGPFDDLKIGIIGHRRDKTSYYLDLFQWPLIEMPAFHNDLSATSIREKWLRGVREKDLEVPNGVQQFLKRLPVERGDKLAEEAAFLREYKKQWSTTPYPVIFTTVDTVVTKGPYVLLVTRDALPGKGLKALPGGFLDPEERILDGAIRELKEETSIEVPPTVLRKSVVNNKVFDAVGRSKRGRTITHAFHINLDSEKTVGLPAIKAQKGETRKVNWVSLAWCIRNGEEFFEDHLQIIRYFTGI